MSDDDPPPAVDAAWGLIEEGRPDEALAELADLEHAARWPAEAAAWLDLGRLAEAHDALARIASELGEDTLEYAWTAAEIALREWRLEEAERHFRACQDAEGDAAVLDRLALLAELRGDEALADRLLARAAAADPDALPPPPRLSTEAFEACVREAIGDLPEPYQRELEHAEVVVERVPSIDLIDRSDPAETPPDLLGLFVGESALDRDEDASAGLPPRIYLFQRNLERSARDETVLREEIRITLYHELAHLLGFDEDGVEGMGLE